MTFEIAVEFVLAREGGYTNNLQDPGGATNFGISQRAHPTVNIRTLTRDQAKAIYRSDYWDECGCDGLPDDTRLIVFDAAVNQGVTFAVILSAMSSPDKMIAARLRRYTANPHWNTFGRGWVNRVAELLEQA